MRALTRCAWVTAIVSCGLAGCSAPPDEGDSTSLGNADDDVVGDAAPFDDGGDADAETEEIPDAGADADATTTGPTEWEGSLVPSAEDNARYTLRYGNDTFCNFIDGFTDIKVTATTTADGKVSYFKFTGTSTQRYDSTKYGDQKAACTANPKPALRTPNTYVYEYAPATPDATTFKAAPAKSNPAAAMPANPKPALFVDVSTLGRSARATFSWMPKDSFLPRRSLQILLNEKEVAP